MAAVISAQAMDLMRTRAQASIVILCAHGFSWIFVDFYGFLWIFMDFHGSCEQ
jgi:hypothetical protein